MRNKNAARRKEHFAGMVKMCLEQMNARERKLRWIAKFKQRVCPWPLEVDSMQHPRGYIVEGFHEQA